MQIVIDIPDDLRKMIFDQQMFDIAHSYQLAKCVSEGTPLPEHHGRLIDADRLLEYKYPIDSPLCVYEDVVNVTDIDNALTIIEATEEDD